MLRVNKIVRWEVERVNSLLLRWWFLFCTQIALGTVAYHFNFFHHLYREDTTRIGFFILGILVLTTLWLGKKIYSRSKDFSTGWFIAESCVVLGLVGTVTGFILMLGSVANAASLDVNTMQKILTQMSAGMGTALLTTLTGLIGSILLGLQYLLLDKGADSLIENIICLTESLAENR